MDQMISAETEKTRARRRSIGPGLAQAVVSHVYSIPLEELRAPTRRSPRAAFGRQLAMYLTHVVCEFSLSEVADAFGRDRTTASHACHVIEDMRDDPLVDRQVSRMELILREASLIEVQQ